MKEIREIIHAFDESQKLGKQTALATVVHVDGSSYRRPGARMLMREDGYLTGAISGGCLEGDALRKALLAMAQKKSKLVTYDTNDEDDAKLGMGLGCNGIIQVLIEPIDVSDPGNPIQLLKILMSKRQQNVLVTLFSLQIKKKRTTWNLFTCCGRWNRYRQSFCFERYFNKRCERSFGKQKFILQKLYHRK